MVILTIFLVYQNEFEPTINTILAIVINGKEIVIRLGFSGVSGICGLLGDKVVLRQVLTTLGMLGMVTVAILPLFLTQFQNNNLQIYTRTITGVCEKGVVIEYALLEGSIGSDGYCAEGRCIKFGYDRFLKCGRRIDDVVIGNGTLRDYLIRFPASEGVIGGLGNGNVTVGKSESECGGDVNLPLSRIMSIWGEY